MKKLYMIGLGGSIKQANIEIHDMQFTLAQNKEEAINNVIPNWYGDSLHIDSYTEVNVIDGYTIDYTKQSDLDLYLIVFGGYKQGTIDELHDYHFLLANSKEDAKAQAKKDITSFNHMDHVDEIVNISKKLNTKFGFIKTKTNFKDNITTHTFIKIK